MPTEFTLDIYLTVDGTVKKAVLRQNELFLYETNDVELCYLKGMQFDCILTAPDDEKVEFRGKQLTVYTFRDESDDD